MLTTDKEKIRRTAVLEDDISGAVRCRYEFAHLKRASSTEALGNCFMIETEDMAEDTAIKSTHMKVHLALEEVVIGSILDQPIYLLDGTTSH